MQIFLLFCLGFVPFIVPFRAYPDPLIVSTQTTFILLAMLLLSTAFRSEGFRLGRVGGTIVATGCLLVLHGVLVGAQNAVVAALPGGAVVLGGLVIALFNGVGRYDRVALARAFALGLVVGGGFNILSGWAQWLGLDLGPMFIGADDLASKRIHGNIGQTNIFVSYIFITYFAFLYLVADKPYALKAAVCYGALVGLTIALTASRAAFLYALVALVVPFWAAVPVRRVWFWPAVMLLVFNIVGQALIYFFGDSLVGAVRLVGEDGYRLDEYRKAVSIFIGNLPFGVGMQNYALSSFEFSVRGQLPSATGDAWSHPHNLFLMLLAGCGLVGVLVSVVILWVAVYVLKRREKDGAWLFAAGALGCIFLHSQLEYPLWLFGYFVVFCILLGIAIDENGYAVRPLGRGLVVVAMASAGLLSVHAVYGYFVLVRNYAPIDGADVNRERIRSAYAVSVNPLISQAADLVVLNYLVPSKENWLGGYCLFEKLARSVPSYTLLDNMAFYAWYAGEDELAKSILMSRNIYYPKRDWGALNGMFQRYYPGLDEGWSRFSSLEEAGFNHAKPYMLTESGVCGGR